MMSPAADRAEAICRKLEVELQVPAFRRRELKAFVASTLAGVAAEEREACARVADLSGAAHVAAAIRSRK